MLSEKDITLLREELKTAKNPLFFYDDDPDGLCSFLLLYKLHREGIGIIVKSAPKLDLRLFRKVEELNPDKIFILDIPLLAQEFIDKAKRPIFYLDHHQPQSLKELHYFNPRFKDPEAYLPTSYMAYQINPDELWIAAVGCLADYYMPDFMPQFIARYPQLLDQMTDLPTALYQKPIGKLVRLFSFLLKGSLVEVKKSVKILSRIKGPEELLNQTTSQGRFLFKRFEKINLKYEILLEQAKKQASRSRILLFPYTEQEWSFTTDLSNELSSLYPQKIIIVARQKSGEMKCSLRAKFAIDKVLERSLQGVSGYGGGHPQACGAVIKEEDWEKFLQNFKRELKC